MPDYIICRRGAALGMLNAPDDAAADELVLAMYGPVADGYLAWEAECSKAWFVAKAADRQTAAEMAEGCTETLFRAARARGIAERIWRKMRGDA